MFAMRNSFSAHGLSVFLPNGFRPHLLNETTSKHLSALILIQVVLVGLRRKPRWFCLRWNPAAGSGAAAGNSFGKKKGGCGALAMPLPLAVKYAT